MEPVTGDCRSPATLNHRLPNLSVQEISELSPATAAGLPDLQNHTYPIGTIECGGRKLITTVLFLCTLRFCNLLYCTKVCNSMCLQYGYVNNGVSRIMYISFHIRKSRTSAVANISAIPCRELTCSWLPRILHKNTDLTCGI